MSAHGTLWCTLDLPQRVKVAEERRRGAAGALPPPRLEDAAGRTWLTRADGVGGVDGVGKDRSEAHFGF
jgi:hypothetical protein